MTTITYTRAARLGVASAYLATIDLDDIERVYDVAIERRDERFELHKTDPACRWTTRIRDDHGNDVEFFEPTVTAAKARVARVLSRIECADWDDEHADEDGVLDIAEALHRSRRRHADD